MSEIIEQPKKKRRSKWDVTGSGATHPDATPTGTAAMAAARINAMLAAKGKLMNKDDAILPPTSTQSLGNTRPTVPANVPLVAKTTLLTPPPNVAPLYTLPPSTNTFLPYGQAYVQDKVFVGLEGTSESFKLIEKLKGPSDTYLSHIATQTGGRIHLRGRGSGFIEPTSGRESFEALHIYISHASKEGMGNARKLCESLIESVKKEYETFKSALAAPLGFGKSPGYSNSPARPYINPYSHQPVPPPGYGPPPPHGYGPPHPGPPVAPGYGYYPPVPPPHGYGPPPPGPRGYYGPPPPPHPYPPHPSHMQPPPPSHMHPPPPEIISGPPNAFTDYRTYDKVSVQTTDDRGPPTERRKFSEETVSQTRTEMCDRDRGDRAYSNGTNNTQRSFTENPHIHKSQDVSIDERGGLGKKRKFIEDQPSTDQRRFAERDIKPDRTELAGPAEASEETQPPKMVGKWQELTQITTTIPQSKTLGGEKTLPEKVLMPPPSLPGGFGRSKVTKKSPASGNHSDETSNNSNKVTMATKDDKVIGLSLLAHYGDDSDSDTDV